MTQPTANWSDAPLSALIRHILETHHRYCREASARLAGLFADELRGRDEAPQLSRLQQLFSQLQSAILLHLTKEEQILFPMIGQLERAAEGKEPMPNFAFGSIAAPIRMMGLEHREAESVLARMRELSGGFAAPGGAGDREKEIYAGLREFSDDFDRHARLEDDVLFPRAIALQG